MNRRNFFKAAMGACVGLASVVVVEECKIELEPEAEKVEDLGGYLVPQTYTDQIFDAMKTQSILRAKPVVVPALGAQRKAFLEFLRNDSLQSL